jgi:crotonobetainyl-CoA:carnitine CoA-transferase CaiB-like acyl-CoA transferase
MVGRWVAATGILAGLYARAASGRGQRVATSLLGAGMLLHSGVFQRDGRVVRGPELDAGQTGYGPGYRLYEAGDDGWLALVVPDPEAWARLRSLPEAAFASAPAADWVARLHALGVPAERVEAMDRDRYRRGILDDPVNRQLGRVVEYDTADWGHFEQIGPLLRCGPSVAGGPALMLPGVGEHSAAVLTDLGFGADEIDALLAAKVVRQG